MLHEQLAADHELLKQSEKTSRMDHLKKVDSLNRLMRTMQGQLHDQDVAMKEQDRTAAASELNQTNLEEQLQLQTEALRITSLRLRDVLQQHDNETLRHQQEQSSLKLQLALERKKTSNFGAPGGDGFDGTDETQVAEALLERRNQESLQPSDTLFPVFFVHFSGSLVKRPTPQKRVP